MKIKITALLIALCLMLGFCLADGEDLSDYYSLSYIIENAIIPDRFVAQNNQDSFRKLLDGRADTVYEYTAWQSLSTDEIAEAYVFFNSISLSDIWIKNGNQRSAEEYSRNARIGRIDIVVHSGESIQKFEFKLSDRFEPNWIDTDYVNGFQRLRLPKVIHNVDCVELWIRSWYQGSENKYNLSITNIVFLSDAPREIPSPSSERENANLGVSVKLKQRLSTRSGPSTKYTELGSFLKKGDTVKAISCAYDKINEIWWVQVEFSAGGEKRRAYTGLKRLELDISTLPKEEKLYENVSIKDDIFALIGPGSEYRQHYDFIQKGTKGDIYAIQNNYAQFEFFDTNNNQKCRVWIGMDDFSE